MFLIFNGIWAFLAENYSQKVVSFCKKSVEILPICTIFVQFMIVKKQFKILYDWLHANRLIIWNMKIGFFE